MSTSAAAVTPASPLHKNWDLVLSGLLRCILNPEFVNKYGNFLKPAFFYEGESDSKVLAMRHMFDMIVDSYRLRRHTEQLGSLLAFEIEVKKMDDGPTLDESLLIIERFKDPDDVLNKLIRQDQVQVQFLDYLKMIRIREWTKDFNKPWKAGDMVSAQQTLNELTSSLTLLNKMSHKELDPDSMFQQLEQMSSKTFRNFRFGNPYLDGAHGFFESDTLNLFAAPPGRGKSMMANTILRLAIMQGKYVHLTVVENREENFIPRIVSALVGVEINDLKGNFHNLSHELKRRVKVAQDLVKTYLTVTFMYGQGVEAVQAQKIEHDAWRKANNKPAIDIDIIDYTGHIVHYSGNGDDGMHIRFRNAYAMRKDFALITKKICFDFVQINRSGTKKNDGGGSNMGMEDLATSFDLAQVCDTLISINQNELDKANNEVRLYVAKGREGGLGNQITVKTLFQYGRFDMNYNPAKPDQYVPDLGMVEGGNYLSLLAPITTPPLPDTPPEKGDAK